MIWFQKVTEMIKHSVAVGRLNYSELTNSKTKIIDKNYCVDKYFLRRRKFLTIRVLVVFLYSSKNQLTTIKSPQIFQNFSQNRPPPPRKISVHATGNTAPVSGQITECSDFTMKIMEMKDFLMFFICRFQCPRIRRKKFFASIQLGTV